MPFIIDALKFVHNAEHDATLAAELAITHHLPDVMAKTARVKVTWDGDLHLDYDALWKAIPAAPVEASAREIAANVDVGSVTDAEVGVMMSTTKRGAPVALVTILHPAGLAMEAKHGTLKKAAAACGLEVKSK
jgi:hypothetical protein